MSKQQPPTSNMVKPTDHPFKNMLIGGIYHVERKLGAGSFGEIYLGRNTETGQMIAIKTEPINGQHPQLEYEARVYKALYGGVGIPYVEWFGMAGNYLAFSMDLLGSSLEDLFNYCGRKFTLKTTLLIADQMFSRIEFIHNKGFLHRDIKPDNFLMGAGKRQNVLHVIDFGLAKKYRYPKTGEHIPHKEGKSLTGTARYASINTHIGLEQSRRDDLEAIGYVLIYFLNGLLPWQGLKGKDDKQQNKQERYDLIMQKKISTSIEELCHGLPEEFVLYMKYVRKLKFEEEPKYGRIRQLFRDIFVKYEYVYDYKFDWQLVREKEERARIQKMGMQ